MPRPFYLIGHNTNSLALVRAGLERGLNAFEVDVNKDAKDRLYVSHEAVNGDSSPLFGEPPPKLDVFLADLKRLVSSPAGANVALVIFDCKVADAKLAVELLKAVRTHLTEGGTSLEVIVSVPSVENARSFFRPISGQLTAREALMIDEEDAPESVAAFFADLGVERSGYGNGITSAVGVGLPSPELVSQMDEAVALMATGRLRFVYPWVLVAGETMREFVRTGVSGILVDVDNAETLVSTLAEPEFASKVRRAARDDDALERREWLILDVATADVSQGGTDATVEFELTTLDGRTHRRSVNAAANGRFERGALTQVTFPGLTLEPERVRSIAVSHDGGGLGPGWTLASVTLRARGAASKRVAFDVEIPEGRRVTRTL